MYKYFKHKYQDYNCIIKAKELSYFSKNEYREEPIYSFVVLKGNKSDIVGTSPNVNYLTKGFLDIWFKEVKGDELDLLKLLFD